MNARFQRFLPPARLAEDACHIEIDVLKEPIGKQDQYAAAFGGLNHFIFHSDGRTTVERIFLAAETIKRLEASLFLLHLGISRSASTILHEQTRNLADTKIFETQKAMVAQVDIGIQLLRDGDLDGFGRLLHEAWVLKRTLASKISDGGHRCLLPTRARSWRAGRKVGWRRRRRISIVLLPTTGSKLFSRSNERAQTDSVPFRL